MRRPPPKTMPARRRAAAWLVTGPVGFFVGGVLDWLALAVHYVRARARGRDPWA